MACLSSEEQQRYGFTFKAEPVVKLWDRLAQKEGLRHKVYFGNGDYYKGEWKNNQRHGYGCQFWKKRDALYEGNWLDGKPNGYGEWFVKQQNTWEVQYKGNWTNGMKHGKGKFFYSTDEHYDGEWRINKRNGWGIHYDRGNIYAGDWVNDQYHGNGHFTYANGNWYKGSWENGKKHGSGELYNLQKNQCVKGFWVDGNMKGGTVCNLVSTANSAIPPIQLVDPESVLKDLIPVPVEAEEAPGSEVNWPLG